MGIVLSTDPTDDTMTPTPGTRDAVVAPIAGTLLSHARPLVRLAWAMTGDQSVAEDLVADAVAKVWVRHQATPVMHLGPYLRTAVINAVRDHGRAQNRRRGLRSLLAAPTATSTDPASTVADRSDLADALRRLPVDQRICVALRFYAGLPVSDVSAALDMPEGTVRSKTSRALASLRDRLEEAQA
jgi:RNA polymerase sigma factor (sigma-70 family)